MSYKKTWIDLFIFIGKFHKKLNQERDTNIIDRFRWC